MSEAVATKGFSTPLRIALIAARVIFGLVFIGAGLAKLAGMQPMVDEFATVGLGQWFRYFTGLVEVAGALLLVRPFTVTYGAGLLTLVSAGAFVAQLEVLHKDVVHTIVFATILASVAYAYRGARR